MYKKLFGLCLLGFVCISPFTQANNQSNILDEIVEWQVQQFDEPLFFSDDRDSTALQQLAVEPLFMDDGPHKFSIWVTHKLVYPKKCKKQRIQGKVILQFTVDTDGSVVDIKVLEGVHRLLDKEAVRVVSSSPKWTPGQNEEGEPVPVTYTFPVIFRLRK